MRNKIFLAVFFSLASILSVSALKDPVPGRIQHLTISDGSGGDTTITITSAVVAKDVMGASSLSYSIAFEDGTVYATHTTTVPPLDWHGNFDDLWTTDRTGWPAGDYTVTLEWIVDGVTLDVASTTIRKVPTLGWELGLVGLSLLLFLLWRRRAEFEPVVQKATA